MDLTKALQLKLVDSRFGRKKTMMVLLAATIVAGTANRFAPNYPTFLVGQFPANLHRTLL